LQSAQGWGTLVRGNASKDLKAGHQPIDPPDPWSSPSPPRPARRCMDLRSDRIRMELERLLLDLTTETSCREHRLIIGRGRLAETCSVP